MIKIVDESELKVKNKLRDDSLTKHCKSCDAKKVDHIKVIRSVKGEIICWETHYIEEKKKKN